MTFDLNNLTIGQEVAISPASNHGVRYHFGYKVKALSPKRDRITVVRESDGYERIFTGKGREVGATRNWVDTLHTNAAELKAAAIIDEERRSLAHEIHNLGMNLQLGYEPSLASMAGVLDEMQNKINAAREKLAALTTKIESAKAGGAA